jgi:hypothetical protein
MATKIAKWAPVKYELGLTRTVRPMIAKLGPSKRTMESVGIVTDFLVGGVLASTVFMTVSPHCIMPGNPMLGSHPEAALLTGVALSGLWWMVTGENYTTLATLGGTVALYGICKLFVS